MENSGNFRKSLFGFNRKDVMDYIAQLHNEYYAYRKEQEKLVAELYEKIEKSENSPETQERVFSSEQLEMLCSQNKPQADIAGLETLVERLEELCRKLENSEK